MNDSIINDLQSHFRTLLQLSTNVDDNLNVENHITNDNDSEQEHIHHSNNEKLNLPLQSIDTVLDNIKGILNDNHQANNLNIRRNKRRDESIDKITNEKQVNESTFIRTNLSRYNDDNARNLTSFNISLRTVLESKTNVCHLQRLFTQLMTTSQVNSSNDYIDSSDEENEEEFDITSTYNKQNHLSITALKACHVYLQSCLLPGSWSCGWIDVVSIRYIETLIRKWSVFCCEYKMMLNTYDERNEKKLNKRYNNDNSTRLKRSRMNDYEHCDGHDENDCVDKEKGFENERHISEILQLGVELSQTMSHVLFHSHISSFWNWNEECRDAFLDSMVLSLSTCTALTTTLYQGNNWGNSEMKCRLDSIVVSCKEAVYDITVALETSIMSSVDHEMVTKGRMNDDDNDDDDDFEIGIFSPNENGVSVSSVSLSRATTTTLLRNIYPLLTYQNSVPNGVKGKQEVFEKCQQLLCSIVKHLSSKLKRTTQENDISMNKGSIQTPGLKRNEDDNNKMLTPLSGRRRKKSRLSLSPKSTNRKRVTQNNKDDLNALLNVPPSLKKNVTPKRASHRKSLSRQQQSIRTVMKSTQRRMKQYEVKEKCLKDILDMFIAVMQKVSTGKMMERVEVRNRMSDLISSLLESMKDVYKKTFVSFAIRLCSSKVSSHRVFAVELLSLFLVEDWLWELDTNIDHQRIEVDQSSSSSQKKQRTQSIDCEFPQNESIHLMVEENIITNGSSQQHATNLSNEVLSALHDRITDRAPAVRTRVAIALSSLFSTFQKIAKDQDEIYRVLFETSISIQPYLISSLRQRAYCDDKATVRKAAIQALVEILSFEVSNKRESRRNLAQEDVSVLRYVCQDKSVAVRKAAAEALVSLLLHVQKDSEGKEGIHCSMLESAWVQSVMPMIHDPEQSCITKVVESFESLVILPICESSAEDFELAPNRLNSCWRILSLINSDATASGEVKGAKNSLKLTTIKAFENKDSKTKKMQCVAILNQFKSITNDTQTINDDLAKTKFEAIWCMIENIGKLDSNVNVAGVINLKTVLRDSDMNTELLVSSCKKFLEKCNDLSDYDKDNRWSSLASTKSCLNSISSFALYMKKDEIKSLAFDLKAATKSFQLVLDLIGPSTNALISLAAAFCEDGLNLNVAHRCADWIKEIFYGCEAYLNAYVSSQTLGGQVDDTKLSRVIYTVGEMSMVGYKPNEDNKKQLVSLRRKSSSDGDVNPIEGLHICPSKRLIRLIQSVLPHTLPSTDETPGSVISSVVRAHAFVSFGKLCLRDESLTKENLNVFAKELSQDGPDSNDAVRSNALLVLGDLCITYTNLVDKFIPLMASCLQTNSKSSIVQQHALILFSNLLLQGYIKWKGLLFHRFAAATVANDLSVSKLAKTLLCGPLLSKEKTLILNNFVGAVFVLNGCNSHAVQKGNRLSITNDLTPDMEFVLKIDDPEKRMNIYSFLLDNMEDEEKIAITARLAKEILSSATETSGVLANAASMHGGVTREHGNQLHGAYSVLSDCLTILVDPRIMVGKTRSVDSSECEDLNSSLASIGPSITQLSSVKNRLLSKINRKHLIESMIPILCNLKVVLEKSRSPLLKNLMEYLVCIFRQYKQEVHEVLESDATLLQEIKYDTRKFEKSRAQDIDELE